ncbi:Metallo-beta-lactamase domain protein [uncultured Desulfobacterium sp.]|uniref:Metallo-beta-lactamase domain protein n=1 Tax=uncultured Desulfobacterium sp. TaxID=201089 RepID=A0A445N2M1_9BACT|nr:Metallo-beta-lactamase domain protein [uncultured Desulfobacterium sp.]
MVRVTCLGGVGTVTGSCYLVESPQGKRVLVDCGLFQGGKQIETRNWEDWGFDPASIEVLFLTHAHIDHSGRIPKLVKDGFRGKIFTSPPTAELCEIMLLDSAFIQEMDAEWQTRKNRRQIKGEVIPLYTVPDAERSIRLLSPVERDKIIEVAPGIRARLRNAGHILGSSILELWIEEKGETIKTVFSGDLGKKNQLIVRDPQEIFDADYLFIESTYGNRMHRSFEESTHELLEAIHYSLSHGEKVIIPAFAVERTQEILYVLAGFERQGLLPDIPVFIDSPLAIKATEIFKKNKKYYDEEAQALLNEGYDPFDMPNLHFTASTKESMAINERQGPAIVIAANGMCTAGRIKHHLKHNLWREGASIVIVGFQAEGTTGRKIVEGAKRVKIFREDVAVRAKVFTIGGFSAHADREDLLEWVSHFESRPRVFVVHGETTASETLALEISKRFGLIVHAPKWMERIVLSPREAAYEEPEAEAGLPEAKTTFLNKIIDLENEIKRLKKRIKATEQEKDIREDDVDRLRYIEEELREILV